MWGQGLGQQALCQFLDKLFIELNMDVVIAQPGDWNERSIRLFESAGFVETNREEIPATSVHEAGTMVTLRLTRSDYCGMVSGDLETASKHISATIIASLKRTARDLCRLMFISTECDFPTKHSKQIGKINYHQHNSWNPPDKSCP